MAKLNHIPREEQDQFALRSHRLAAAGTQDGRLTAEIMPVYVPPKYETVLDERQRHPRRHDASSSSRALKPVFDRKYGTVTAGNSSPLTDGARAVLLMSEERAQALGYTPLGVHPHRTRTPRSIPASSCCMGPVLAAPVALQRAGLDARATSTSSRCTRRSPRRCCSNLQRLREPGVGRARRILRAGRRSRSREA